MTEGELLDRLDELAPDAYVAAVRRDGRQHLDPSMRAAMAELYEDVRVFTRTRALSPEGRAVLRVARPVLEAEWQLAAEDGRVSAAVRADEVPLPGKRYAAYANLELLGALLAPERPEVTGGGPTDGPPRGAAGDPARGADDRVRAAVLYLAASWSAYERRSLAGDEGWNAQHTPRRDALVTRTAILDVLARDLSAATGRPIPAPVLALPSRWTAYAADACGHLALEFLTALPQTNLHEEVAFIRTIHLTEACTWGMLGRARGAIDHIRRGDLSAAERSLARAVLLAEVQVRAFNAMRTMTPDDFLQFRASTGKASAVQSTSNHLLLIFLMGVDPAKVEALQASPETRHLLRYAQPGFVCLRDLLREVDGRRSDGAALLARAEELDHWLARWRSAHYGAARRYLPPDAEGTGGTSGARYLKAFYSHRAFPLTDAPTAPPSADGASLPADPAAAVGAAAVCPFGSSGVAAR